MSKTKFIIKLSIGNCQMRKCMVFTVMHIVLQCSETSISITCTMCLCMSTFHLILSVINSSYIIDPDEKMHHLVLVAYKFDKVPQDAVLVNPHGNFKSKKKPYH